MREIKFRAWDSFIGKFVYFDFNNLLEKRDELFSVHGVIPHSHTIQQYTGLKDRNGKEIYKGDIVKQTYHAERGNEYTGVETYDGHHIGEVVITANKGVCMKNPLCYSEETDETKRSNQYKTVTRYRSEVIGNIYENPELLQR